MKPQEHVFHISAVSVAKAISVGFLFFVLFLLRDLLLVVLAAVVIASAVEPITRWFGRFRIARLPAVILVYVCLALLLIAVFSFLFLPLLKETANLLNTLPEYVSSVGTWGSPSEPASAVGTQTSIISNISQNFSFREIALKVNQALSNISGGFWSTASFAFGGVLSFILIVVLSFYLAVQDHGIANFLSTITPAKQKSRVLELWRRVEAKIGLWMQGQLLLVVIVGVLVYLGLTLIGVSHALPLAVLAGIFELIPLFGPILSAIPALGIAFVDGGVSMALITGGLYLIIQQFENHLIYPLVVKKVVGIPPVIVIVALVAGYTLAGFLGVLLSVPLAVVLLEILHDFQKDHVASKPKDPSTKA